MKTNTLLLVMALLIISMCIQCASCTSCWANESYFSAVCTPPLGMQTSNVSEAIPLVPAGRLECTNFTDFEGITEAGRTAAGVIVAILGSLAQFSGFVLIKFCYVKKTANLISFVAFQWIMSISMWLVGMVVNFAITGQPIFYYFSTTGGILLSLGLLLILPVIGQFGIAISGAIISITILIANWLLNQYGLCVECSNSVACISSVVLLFISAFLLLVVGVMKKDSNNELSLPYHGHDTADVALSYHGHDTVELSLPYHGRDTADVALPYHGRDTVDVALPYHGRDTADVALPYHGRDTVDVALPYHGRDTADVALPYHGRDGAKLHQSLQQEARNKGGRRQRDAFSEPIRPAKKIPKNGANQSDESKPLCENKKDISNNPCKIHLKRARKRVMLAFAGVLIGLCWGWQYVSIKFLRKCDDSSLFPCNSLAYLFGHLSGSLIVTSLFLIILLSSWLAIVKLPDSRGVQTVKACQPAGGPSIEPIMILSAAFAGILWGLGLVGQLAAESMIPPGIATPIITIVFAISTSIFALKEVYKVCKYSLSELEGKSLFLMFGLSLLVSVVAMVVFIVGYTTE